MVGFHPINKTMTVGTFMFISSMVVIALGALVSLPTLLCLSLPSTLLLWSGNILAFSNNIVHWNTAGSKEWQVAEKNERHME